MVVVAKLSVRFNETVTKRRWSREWELANRLAQVLLKPRKTVWVNDRTGRLVVDMRVVAVRKSFSQPATKRIHFLTCQIVLRQRGLTCIDLCGDFRCASQFVARTSQHAYAQVNLLTCTSQFVGNDLGAFSQYQGISRYSRAPGMLIRLSHPLYTIDFAVYTQYHRDL